MKDEKVESVIVKKPEFERSKLKKITFHKSPSIAQIKSMSHNLWVKYQSSASILVEFESYSTCVDLTYKIYLRKRYYYSKHLTWLDCYNAYLELMEDKT